MAVGHVGQPTSTATMDEIKRMLFVRQHAVLEATRLTLADTVVLPKSYGHRAQSYSLRHLDLLPPHILHEYVSVAETHWYLSNPPWPHVHSDLSIDTWPSIPLHQPLNSLSHCYHCLYASLLPALASQLGVPDAGQSPLPQCQTSQHRNGCCWGRHRHCDMDGASFCCLGSALTLGSQARHHSHVRFRNTVRRTACLFQC